MKRYIIISAFVASNIQIAYATSKEDIYAKGTHAYVVDQENRIVRDNFDGCVRSIHWSKETAIPACEGWPKSVKQAEPPQNKTSASTGSHYTSRTGTAATCTYCKTTG